MMIERHGEDVAVVGGCPATDVKRGAQLGGCLRREAEDRLQAAGSMPECGLLDAAVEVRVVGRIERLYRVGAVGVAAGGAARPGAIPFNLEAGPALKPRALDAIDERVHLSSGSRR
ncbi:hypothetical protein ACFSX5_19135 [Devosia albogilva]|uniref:Uncharacterized protein n=1 Tax=Devosia albogilva TaxID=429726 RepID=A0ABW5QQB1_9HYPH